MTETKETTIKAKDVLLPLASDVISNIRVAVVLDPRNHGKVLQEWSALEQLDVSVVKEMASDDKLDIIPIVVRVIMNRKPMYYRTGKAVSIPQFYVLDKAQGNSKLAVVKKDVLLVYNKIRDHIRELVKEGRFNFDNLREKFTNKTKDSFFGVWSDIISEKKINTADNYRQAYSSFVSAVGRNVNFANLTPQLIGRWIKRMREDGKGDSTIGMYLRAIRVPINKSIAMGYITPANNPMKGIKIPKGKRRTYDSIDIPTINRLRFADVPEYLKQSVEFWVFSYLNGGMNMADMVDLVYTGHYFKSEGRELIFVRKKTENTTSDAVEILIPVYGEIKRIIEKHGSKPIMGERVFPMLLGADYDGTESMKVRRISQANQNIRKRLYKVCEMLDMPMRVSPTWARHSFKTNAEHKGINNTYIEMAMGHALPGVQQNYMGSWRYEERIRYVDMLLEDEKPTLNLDGFSADQLKELQKLIAERLVKGA